MCDCRHDEGRFGYYTVCCSFITCTQKHGRLYSGFTLCLNKRSLVFVHRKAQGHLYVPVRSRPANKLCPLNLSISTCMNFHLKKKQKKTLN